MFLMTGFSVCAGDDSAAEVSIYNSTDYNAINEISTMRANMTGYQSNVDYISSDYGVYYES
jgi:hypothetical protein